MMSMFQTVLPKKQHPNDKTLIIFNIITFLIIKIFFFILPYILITFSFLYRQGYGEELYFTFFFNWFQGHNVHHLGEKIQKGWQASLQQCLKRQKYPESASGKRKHIQFLKWSHFHAVFEKLHQVLNWNKATGARKLTYNRLTFTFI